MSEIPPSEVKNDVATSTVSPVVAEQNAAVVAEEPAVMPVQMDIATYQAFLAFQQKQAAKESEKKEKKDKSDKKEKKDKSDKKEKKDKSDDEAADASEKKEKREKKDKADKKEKKDKKAAAAATEASDNASTEALSLPQTQLGLGSPQSGEAGEAFTPLHNAAEGSAFTAKAKRSTKPPSASPLPRLVNDGRTNEEIRQAMLAEGHSEDSIPVALLQQFAMDPSVVAELTTEAAGPATTVSTATASSPPSVVASASKAKAPAPKGKGSKAPPPPSSKGLSSFGFFKVASPAAAVSTTGPLPTADGAAVVATNFTKDMLFQGFEESSRRIVPTALRLWGPSRPQVAHGHVFGGLPELVATAPTEHSAVALSYGDTPQKSDDANQHESKRPHHHRLFETIAAPTAACMWLDAPIRSADTGALRPQIVTTNATMLERLLRCRLNKNTFAAPQIMPTVAEAAVTSDEPTAVVTKVQPDGEASVMEIDNPHIAKKESDEPEVVEVTPHKAHVVAKELEAFAVAPLSILAGDATAGEFFFPSDSARHSVDIRNDDLAQTVTGIWRDNATHQESDASEPLSKGTHTTAPPRSSASNSTALTGSPLSNACGGTFFSPRAGMTAFATEALLTFAGTFMTADQLLSLQKQFDALLFPKDFDEPRSPLSSQQQQLAPKVAAAAKKKRAAMLGNFCCEVVYTAFVSTTYKPFEIRPPYFGTHNNPLLPMVTLHASAASDVAPLYPATLDSLRAAAKPKSDESDNTNSGGPTRAKTFTTARAFARFPPSEDITQIADVPYDYESAEGWDSDRDSADDVGASGESSEMDDDSASSEDDNFINDGKVVEEGEEFSDSEEEIDVKQQQEQEKKHRRALQLNTLCAASYGPFGHLSLPEHPFHANYDYVEQLTYVHPRKFTYLSYQQWQQLELETIQKTDAKKAKPKTDDTVAVGSITTATANTAATSGEEHDNANVATAEAASPLRATSPSPITALPPRVQPSYTRSNLNGMLPNLSSVYNQLMERLLVSHGVVSKEDMVAMEASKRAAGQSSHLEGVESEAQKDEAEERRQRLLLENKLEVTEADLAALSAIAMSRRLATLRSVYEAARAEHLCLGVSNGKLIEAISKNFTVSFAIYPYKCVVLKASITPEMEKLEEARKAEIRRKNEEVAERKRKIDEAVAAGLPPPVFARAKPPPLAPAVAEPSPPSAGMGKWLTSVADKTAGAGGFTEAERNTAPKVFSKFDIGAFDAPAEPVDAPCAQPEAPSTPTATTASPTKAAVSVPQPPVSPPKYGFGISSLSYLDDDAKEDSKVAAKRSRSPVDTHGA